MISARIGRPKMEAFKDFEKFSIQRLENAALIATDRAASQAKVDMRGIFGGQRLTRLGMAIGSGSDLRKGGRVQRFGTNGFRTSGWLYIRSKSERTLGAIEAYTEGAEITPRNGRYLWIATDAIPARVGKYRMTPARYNASGLVSSIGPLVAIPGRHAGEMLLVVRNVSTRLAGRPNARRLPKSGRARAGREAQEFIVAFVGIKRTSRTARIDVPSIMRTISNQLPNLIGQALGEL